MTFVTSASGSMRPHPMGAEPASATQTRFIGPVSASCFTDSRRATGICSRSSRFPKLLHTLPPVALDTAGHLPALCPHSATAQIQRLNKSQRSKSPPSFGSIQDCFLALSVGRQASQRSRWGDPVRYRAGRPQSLSQSNRESRHGNPQRAAQGLEIAHRHSLAQ
jgi:hypothetical protein